MRGPALLVALLLGACGYHYVPRSHASAYACAEALRPAAGMRQPSVPASPYPEMDITQVDALGPMAQWQAIRLCEGY